MKNTENKVSITSNGRSMIEMLGVLAIIGVLSVGGIAGYSKAMHRYRVNKTIDQITYMAGSIRTFFAPQKSYDGVGSVNVQKKAKLVPDEMWDSNGNLHHLWGNSVNIQSFGRDSIENGGNAFNINYAFLPEDVCIDLATQDWENADVGIIEIARYYIIPPIDIKDAIKICAPEVENMIDHINFFFDINVNSDDWKNAINTSKEQLKE